GFWYSKDHGASWKRSLPDVATYPNYSWWAGGGSNCNFVLSDPADASIVWASFSAEQPDTRSAIFKSTNSGENWVMSNTNLNPLGLTTHGMSIDIQSNVNSRTLYVTQEGDVWKSTDGGAIWTEIFVNGGLKFTEVDKFNSQLIYAGGENGFFRSTDGGASWTETGLMEMRFSTSVPNAQMRPDIVPENDDLESTPPIVAWQGVFDIKADPNIADRVYVIAHGEGKGLYKSDDAGLTWTKIYNNSEMRGVAIAPNNSDIIYASSSANYHSGAQNTESIGILYSLDAGATWSFANDGMAWTNGGRLDIETGANPNIWAWVPGTGLQYSPIPSLTPLPVIISSPLTARLKNGAVHLRWRTASEEQNSGFEIARSQDGTHWKTLQTVSPNNSKKYLVVDAHPLEGISYYQLTQQDLDGKKTELGIVSIEYTRTNPPFIFPNPTNGVIHISFSKKENNQRIELQLFDNLGQLLISQKNSDELDIRSLPSGNYHLVIHYGGEVWHERVVKE
ncbi:MAG TPA: T9SS type A sorting domain-containing protein, partial [Phaeodactylibacter sp.]|nr:T9SS type A sorting domain-containing protein [Phaeodactylibacter sp.]